MNHKLSLFLSVVSVGEAAVLSAGSPSTTISWPARPRPYRTSGHSWSALRASKELKRDKGRGRQKGSGSRLDRGGRRRDKESDSDDSDDSDSDNSGSGSEDGGDGKGNGKGNGEAKDDDRNKNKEQDSPSFSQQASTTVETPSRTLINNPAGGGPTDPGRPVITQTDPPPTMPRPEPKAEESTITSSSSPPPTSARPTTVTTPSTTSSKPTGSGGTSTTDVGVGSNLSRSLTSTSSNESSRISPSTSLAPGRLPMQTAAIVGVVLGGTALLLLLLLATFLFIRARRKRNRTDSRPHTFYKDKMIKDIEEVPPTPLTPVSISSSGSDSASRTSLSDPLQVNFGGNPALGLGIPSRTSRQMQIEQKIFELQSSLISLNRRTISFRRSNVSSKKVRAQLIRDKIGRLEKLKDGDWAREKSDEKPADMP
ncbi:hypothetical protein PQX77_011876 [Marasmius sp. AFHP31]|nr:hypothetical protein PQX77_011876 [Marasmius sp. AFHP31]